MVATRLCPSDHLPSQGRNYGSHGAGEEHHQPLHVSSALGVNGWQLWWANPLTGTIGTGAGRRGELEAFEFPDRWEDSSFLEIGSAFLRRTRWRRLASVAVGPWVRRAQLRPQSAHLPTDGSSHLSKPENR